MVSLKRNPWDIFLGHLLQGQGPQAWWGWKGEHRTTGALPGFNLPVQASTWDPWPQPGWGGGP